MTDRERLIKILSVPIYPLESADPAEVVADYLLDNDVRPVVHAHWIDEGEDEENPESGNHQYLCSHCWHRDVSSPAIEVPRCWFCGALMDEEVEDAR